MRPTTSPASRPATSRCIQRGTCTFELKAENAAAAGAVGIVFFNQGNTAAPDRNGIPAVTLGNGYTGGIPALNMTYVLGAELSAIAGPRDAACSPT